MKDKGKEAESRGAGWDELGGDRDRDSRMKLHLANGPRLSHTVPDGTRSKESRVS